MVVVDSDVADVGGVREILEAYVRLPEFHVGGEVEQTEALFGVLLILPGFLDVVVGELGVVVVQVVVVDIQRALFFGYFCASVPISFR
ncbi:hypothetical protein C455_05207 [Haloferax larsenii JCM 13917]|nr:hypothetical protein C455_05207 [Haloferax larsenii JCM 13917]